MKNRRPHNKYTPYELSDKIGRLGCYKNLATAMNMAKLIKGSYYIRNLSDRMIEEGCNK